MHPLWPSRALQCTFSSLDGLKKGDIAKRTQTIAQCTFFLWDKQILTHLLVDQSG